MKLMSVVSQWIFALLLSWHLCSLADFFYPFLYTLLDISSHIDHFAPQNLYKSGFALTSDSERFRLFHEIVAGVQHHGGAFGEIRYLNGEQWEPLLRAPEVIHLLDVRHLIDLFYFVGIWCGVFFAISLLYFLCLPKRTRCQPVQNKAAKYPLWPFKVAALFAAVALLSWIGPTRVFYTLHEWVFPSDHQWMFSYQESLMTTLMKAPDIFAAIAIAVVVGALIIGALLGLIKRVLSDRHPKTSLKHSSSQPN
ncbi:DUF1461 domain-containing protein [Vibrio navarrensis]